MARKKLHAHAVYEIRQSYHGGTDAKLLARVYGVNVSTIYAVCNGKTWRHVGGPIDNRFPFEDYTDLGYLDVKTIRRMYADDTDPYKLAADYGISRNRVYDIVTGRVFPDVGGPTFPLGKDWAHIP